MRRIGELKVLFITVACYIVEAQRRPIDNLISQYKQDKLRFREDIYQGNLPILKEYDFIVVGAGPGGSVVANRLTENSQVSVLLLEAGTEENAYTDAPAMSTFILFTEYNWKYKSQRQPGACRAMIDERCTWPSGKGLGGGTLVNGMIYTRGNRKDYDKWEELGNPGWGYDSVLPYFLKSEEMRVPEFINSPAHSTRGSVTVSYPPYRTNLSGSFLDAVVEGGYEVTDYNEQGKHSGFNRIQSTIRDGRRCSASKAFLQPATNRPNLHISQKSLVTRIVIDPKTKVAVGVEFVKKGRKRFVRARKEVVMAAGAFNTPQILLLSGVGPKDHLREMGIPVIADLQVGENLQEHIGLTSLTFTVQANLGLVPDFTYELRRLPINFVNWERTGRTLLSTAGCEIIGYLKSSYAEPGDSPDIELIQIVVSYASDSGANLRKNYDIRDDVYNAVYKELEGRASFSIWIMGMYPYSRGSVKLQSKDPFVAPLIFNNFINDTRDLDVVVQGIKATIALMETPAMKAVGTKLHKTKPPGCRSLDFGTDEYWECYVREFTSQFHHQCGTCKMGPASDPTAVVDPRLKVYGVSRLRVVDASIMPLVPGAHTMAPSYMIGEKAADLIKEDHNLI